MRGDRFRKLREENGYTHEELSELLGMSQKQIWRYENGKTDPSSETVTKIAKTLNTSADYLLGLTDDQSPYIRIDNLTPKEKDVLSAMRRGEPMEAIRILAIPNSN